MDAAAIQCVSLGCACRRPTQLPLKHVDELLQSCLWRNADMAIVGIIPRRGEEPRKDATVNFDRLGTISELPIQIQPTALKREAIV